jgi:hypothetical protein
VCWAGHRLPSVPSVPQRNGKLAGLALLLAALLAALLAQGLAAWAGDEKSEKYAENDLFGGWGGLRTTLEKRICSGVRTQHRNIP